MPERYRVAIIGRTGHGNYGHGIDTVWKDIPEADVVAIADDDPAGLQAAQARTGARTAYADYREMLTREEPQIVGIGPRWIDQHAEIALACIERGCHVYMEKPFCRTLAEADAIISACERKHVKLALSHQTQYSPILPVALELIRSGELGTILEIRGRGKEDSRGGGEDLWVLGSHVLTLMRSFAGTPTHCFGQLRQQARPVTKSDVREGAEGLGPLAGDTVHAQYQFENGVQGYFSSVRGQAGSPSRFGLQVFGSKGVLEFLTGYLPAVRILRDPSWSPSRTGKSWETISSQGLGKPETLEDTNLHGGNVLAVRDLLKAIAEDRQPLCSAYEGRATVEMILAIFESHRQGVPVRLPLENREHPLTMLK